MGIQSSHHRLLKRPSFPTLNDTCLEFLKWRNYGAKEWIASGFQGLGTMVCGCWVGGGGMRDLCGNGTVSYLVVVTQICKCDKIAQSCGNTE